MRRFAAIFLLLAAPVFAETVQTTDGRTLRGTLVALDEKQIVLRGAAEERIPLEKVRSIVFDGRAAGDAMSRAGQQVLVAEDASRIAVTTVTLKDGKLAASAEISKSLAFPVESFARLIRPRKHEKPGDILKQRAERKLARSQKDALLVNSAGDDWIVVTGLLTALEGEKLILNYDGNDTPMEANTVPLIEFAAVKAGAPVQAPAELRCTDGSVLTLKALQINAKQARVTTPALGTFTIDAATLAAIRLQNGTLAYLSDLPIAESKQTGFFDENFALRKDASVAGTPLRIAGVGFEKGLGLHARCEIRYDLGGQYKQLAATVGIDDAVTSGSARVKLVADGKTLQELPVRAGEAGVAVKLDLTGVKTLTIIAEFAEKSLGVGARVNICDPVLAK